MGEEEMAVGIEDGWKFGSATKPQSCVEYNISYKTAVVRMEGPTI